MVEAVLGLVKSPAILETQGSAVTYVPTMGQPIHSPDARFTSGLETLTAGDKTDPVVAGSLELLGLEEVREALGGNWGAIADKAMVIAAAELQLQLDEADIFRRYRQFSFVICFAKLDRATASARASEIARKIKARLAAEIPEVADAIGVDQFVTGVERAALRREGMSLTERLFETLQRVRDEARAQARRTRTALLRNIQLQFAPAWHTGKHVVVLNRCSLDQTSGGRTLAQFQALAEPAQIEDTLAELDCTLLTKAIETLHRATGAPPAGALLTPVSFRTINSPRWQNDYIELLRLIPDAYRRLIILEICDVPSGVEPRRLGELIDVLTPFVKGVSLELEIDHPDLTAILEQGSWALAVNVKGSTSIDPQVPMRLKRFAGAASAAKTVSLAHGANSMGLALAAVNAGFNYVDGPAIHPTLLEPKAPSALNPLANSSLEGTSVRW